MSGAAFLRIKKLKGGGIITKAARHNRRVIQAELGAESSIDPTRSHLNETLHGPLTADDVGQLAKDLMRGAGVVKHRKDCVLGLEFLFSLPVDHQLDDRAYFGDCAAWVADQYGGAQNVLSVDIHRDEGAPHCHVLLLPLLNGKLAGSDMVGGKQKLMATHKHFHEAVASRYGLHKAPARLTSASKQAGAAAVLAKLKSTSDAALKSKAWATIRDAIETNPGPWLLALGIELDVVKKPLKTMAQIFTSKGKGKTNEANPIGFAAPSKEQTLCSVGFTPKPALLTAPKAPAPTPAPARPAPAPAFTDSVRVRDNDLDPARYDPATGEYFQRPPPPTRHNRAAADDWVNAALGSKQLA
jgi:hypothetical protein